MCEKGKHTKKKSEAEEEKEKKKRKGAGVRRQRVREDVCEEEEEEALEERKEMWQVFTPTPLFGSLPKPSSRTLSK